MNSWNQNCILVRVAEYLQRNLSKFFKKNAGQSIGGALILPKKYRTIRQLCRYSQD